VTCETQDRLSPISPPRLSPRNATDRGRGHAVQILLLKAVLGLATFDVLRLGRNFRRMHRLVSAWSVQDRLPSNDIDDVLGAINQACIWYPKRVLCLQRSAVTTCLLRHCGIPAKMVMGAQDLPFKAHAWTEVDGHAVNERRDVQKLYRKLECC